MYNYVLTSYTPPQPKYHFTHNKYESPHHTPQPYRCLHTLDAHIASSSFLPPSPFLSFASCNNKQTFSGPSFKAFNYRAYVWRALAGYRTVKITVPDALSISLSGTLISMTSHCLPSTHQPMIKLGKEIYTHTKVNEIKLTNIYIHTHTLTHTYTHYTH